MKKDTILQKRSNVIDLGLRGFRPKDIANLTGTSYQFTLRTLKVNNIALEGSGGKNRKITKNFLKEDDKSYYFIGYLAADGNIYKTQITLYSTDIEHLEKFANVYNQPFNYYYYISSAGTPMVQLYFGNQKITKYLLEEYNIVPNKSKILSLSRLNWSIIRGIFDGDGSGKRQIKITTGSIFLRDQLIDFFTKEGLNTYYKIKGKNQSCYDIIIKAESSAIFIYNLYKEANGLYLERKYKDICARLSKDNQDKLDKLLETPEEDNQQPS